MPGPERRAAAGAAVTGVDAATAIGPAAAGSVTAPTVTGVDGCAAGWVAVNLGPAVTDLAGPGQAAGWHAMLDRASTGQAAAPLVVRVAVAATLDLLPLAPVTGIDMALGLLGTGWRDVDLLAPPGTRPARRDRVRDRACRVAPARCRYLISSGFPGVPAVAGMRDAVRVGVCLSSCLLSAC